MFLFGFFFSVESRTAYHSGAPEYIPVLSGYLLLNRWFCVKCFVDLCTFSSAIVFWEEFEDTKGIIRMCKSKKNRQHNDQKKRHNRTIYKAYT